MALGAFASKTVACVLEHPAVKYLTPDLGKVVNSLGKGNLWLFYDVVPWHWAYSHDPESFTMCKLSRSAQDPGMEPTVQRTMMSMPWAKDALPAMGQFKHNEHLEAGFRAVRATEGLPTTDIKERPKAQLNNLMAIAVHEQKVVLQDKRANWREHWAEMVRTDREERIPKEAKARANGLEIDTAYKDARILAIEGPIITAKVGEPCPKSGRWEASLPPSHPAAALMAASHSRWHDVKVGQPMPGFGQRLFADAAEYNAAIVWTWHKPL